MIGSEAPFLIAKACELFIRELTMQAWIHTEESKRRTLQVRVAISLYVKKVDITTAVSENEMYDFLIDFIPREEAAIDYSRQAAKPPPFDSVMYMFVLLTTSLSLE